MKKVVISMILLVLSGCTAIGGGGFKEIFGGDERKDVVQKDMNIQKEDVVSMISDVTSTYKQKQRREYSNEYDFYKGYLGEYIVIPIGEENLERVVSKPKNSFLEAYISGGKFNFRSIYQGDFKIELYIRGELSKRISIENVSKYNIKEENLVNIIIQCRDTGDKDMFYKTIDLYKMLYPEGRNSKRINFMLLDQTLKDNQKSKLGEVLGYLLNENHFTLEEKNTILLGLTSIKSKKELTDEFLTFESNDAKLNNLIKNYIMGRNTLNKSEVEFLEKIFKDEPSKEISTKIGNWYNQNGYSELSEKYLTGNLAGYNLDGYKGLGNDSGSENANTMDGFYKGVSEKNYEAFKELVDKGVKSFDSGNLNDSILSFQKALELNRNYEETSLIYSYIAEANVNSKNYSEAISHYKKAIDVEKNPDKKIENYYLLATAYNLNGEIKEYKKYLTFIRQRFPDTVWGRKSLIELNKLNKD